MSKIHPHPLWFIQWCILSHLLLTLPKRLFLTKCPSYDSWFWQLVFCNKKIIEWGIGTWLLPEDVAFTTLLEGGWSNNHWLTSFMAVNMYAIWICLLIFPYYNLICGFEFLIGGFSKLWWAIPLIRALSIHSRRMWEDATRAMKIIPHSQMHCLFPIISLLHFLSIIWWSYFAKLIISWLDFHTSDVAECTGTSAFCLTNNESTKQSSKMKLQYYILREVSLILPLVTQLKVKWSCKEIKRSK